MDEVRFNAAVARALLRKREGGGIGMLGEKTLHSALKYYYEPNELSHEQRAQGYFADVKNEDGIIEVQTGSMGALRGKLREYLKTDHVTVVHPVVRKSAIIWIDSKTGEATRSRSSRVGRAEDAFLQLMYLEDIPLDPSLTVVVPLVDIEEERLVTGVRRGQKRYTKLDKIPTAMVGEEVFSSPADYLKYLPRGLVSGGGFTAKRLAPALGVKSATAHAMLYTLLNLGLAERAKRGRGYVYTVTAPAVRGTDDE